jgi:hypothetical protein
MPVPLSGVPMALLPQLGKHLALCSGFTENVFISPPSESSLLLTTPGSRIWKEYSQVRFPRRVASKLNLT